MFLGLLPRLAFSRSAMSHINQIPSAKNRHPGLFKVTETVIQQLVEWVHDPDIANPSVSALGLVKFCSVVHALNGYRSINLLLETDHWEDAGILTRGLFELVLNLEEICRDARTAEEKAQRFILFGSLQQGLHARALVQYQIDTGRGTKEHGEKVREIDNFLESHFKQFLFVGKKGRKRWRDYWCNMSVRDLAERSYHPTRIHQYTIIYAFLSSFTHSAPMAVMSTFGWRPPDKDWEQFDREHLAKEQDNIILVISLATQFLLEILLFAGDVFPKIDLVWSLSIMNRVYEINGVSPPLASAELKQLKEVFEGNDEAKKEEFRQMLQRKGVLPKTSP